MNRQWLFDPQKSGEKLSLAVLPWTVYRNRKELMRKRFA
jgi:hypothetical protein